MKLKLTNTVWIITDKKRKLIAKGVPRNRKLEFIDSGEGGSRILTYPSKARAISGFRDSWFYLGHGVDKYIEKEYKIEGYGLSEKEQLLIMEAIEVEVTITEK